jgi:hypothetical protein
MSDLFTVTTNGLYPNETYTASVVTSFTDIKGNLQTLTDSKSALPVRSFLRYQKRSTNEIISYLDNPFFSNFFTFKNCTYNLNLDQTFQGDNDKAKIPTIKFNTTSPTITINISSLRQTVSPCSEFYLFYYTITSKIDENNIDYNHYGYMVYPETLCLLANTDGLSQITNGWSLTASIKNLQSVTKNITSKNIELDAINFHKNYYLKNKDNTLTFNDLKQVYGKKINNTNNPLFITPSISASRTIIDKKLIIYSAVNNPSSAIFNLETTSGNYIYPDSTNLSYLINYNTDDYVAFNDLNDQDINNPKFNTSHTIYYNPQAFGNKQLFKIAQYKANPSAYLGDSTNCVLSAIINFDDNTLLYYANTTTYRVRGDYSIPFSISYNVDSPYFLTGESVKPSIPSIPFSIVLNKPNALTNNWKTLTYGERFDTDAGTDNIIIFNTEYPPHYYTYKLDLRDSSNTYYDSVKLNFYLTTEVASKPKNNTFNIVKTFIKSDFNTLTYNFDENNTSTNDLIKYTFYNITSGVYDDLRFTYGPDVYNPDYLVTGQTYATTKYLSGAYGDYIPLLLGKDLKIDYVGAKLGAANLTLRATISTVFGEMDAFEPTTIKLAEDIAINPIVLNVLKEKSNIIYIDSKVNISSAYWPGRCLSGSGGAYVSWNITPTSPDVVMFSVDSNLNYIQDIIPSKAYLWDMNTYTIAVSGYGDQFGYTTTIYLSSQFYDETSTQVIPNSSLFNYFYENKFIVNQDGDINDLERTRKIKLFAKVPYGKGLYNIPKSTPIYWTWKYDSDINPITQTITAYNNKSIYPYATNQLASNLSAINLDITTNDNTKLNFHNITVTVYTDSKNPTLTGSYNFLIDDFPSTSIFNTDFITSYVGYESTIIADTRAGIDTITRSNDKNKNFIFKPNTDVLSKIITDPYSIYWTISNRLIKTTSRDNILSFDLEPYKDAILTTVTLNLTGGFAPGWSNAHNTSTTTYIYLLPPSDFYKPLKFRSFPELAWLNSPYLTTLNTSNYTLIGSPSAYGNTKTKSLAFWLSANKDGYTKYNYQSLSDKSIVQATNYLELVDLSYNDDNIYSDGLSISLTAYNDTYYPAINSITYQEPDDFGMQKYYFNNFSQTLDVSDDNFLLTPKILPYNDLVLNFDVVNPNLTLNLDDLTQRNISINQTLNTSPLNAPAIAIDGTITYILSSKYWEVSANIPIKNGTYDLFTLKIGDPYVPLYTGELGMDNFVLYNVPNIIQQIPESTFKNITYTKNKDLWEAITL